MVGGISRIRENNDKGRRTNSMIHSFWSFRYIIDRLITTAENFGIKVSFINEAYTSSICPWGHSRNIRRHKRLFGCLDCGIKAHLHEDESNRVLAHPLLLRVDDASEDKSPMWMQMRMKPLETRISSL